MLALNEHGRRIPQEVSIVGFDDIPLAPFLWPPLTTVAQDFATIGQRLIALLVEQIRQGPQRTDTHVLVPTELILRASTAPPPRRG